MQRLTLGRARAILPAVCFPVGAAATAATAAPPINMATANILTSGKWLGTLQKVAFNIYDGQITLPRQYMTVLGAALRGTGDRFRQGWNYPIQNEWFQWIPGAYGISTNPPYSTTGFNVMGDGYVTFRDIPFGAGDDSGQCTLRIETSTTEDSGLKFYVRGYNDGEKVYTGTGASRIEGESINIPTSPGVTDGTIPFDPGNSLYSIVKPPTNGVVILRAVDSLGTATVIAQYAPGETLPSYRRYTVPICPDQENKTQAVVFCKAQHVDVVVDNDEIFPPGNPNYLESSMMALNYRRKDNLQMYASYMADAIRALNADLEDVNAEASLSIMQIDPTIGFATVPNLI